MKCLVKYPVEFKIHKAYKMSYLPVSLTLLTKNKIKSGLFVGELIPT